MSSTQPGRRTRNVLLRYRERDTPFTVTRRTTTRLAETLGMTETQVIHLALAELASRHLPNYAPDEGSLQPATVRAIGRRVQQGRMTRTESLF
ncbi:MAG: hypothetical protein EPO25_11975 [Gammaproteobacteria bacterium]|nr:MAG: hypothetical protein EPO25_11975 [Gammaproteobacteria bacterium]